MLGKITCIKFNKNSDNTLSDKWVTVHVVYDDGTVNRLGASIDDIKMFAAGMDNKTIYTTHWDIGTYWTKNNNGQTQAKLKYLMKQ